MHIDILIGGGVVGAVVAAVVWWILHRHHASTATATDATTKSLATSLQDAKARNEIILNSIEDGVVFIDEQGVIQLFNPGATKITGWSRQDAVGLDWKLVFVFQDKKGEPLPDSETPFALASHTKESARDNNANILSKSNSPIAVGFSVSPIVNKDVITGLVGTFRDVSVERKEQAQRAEFISTASHEMRTPVAAIEGYLSLALNTNVATIDSRARDFLEKAHASTKHLGELFQDLLTSAKAEDGRLTNHPEVIEMGAFMEQLTSDLKFTADKKKLALELMVGSNSVLSNDVIDTSGELMGLSGGERVVRPLYNVQVDPERLREVVTNLFDNACKYTDSGKVSLGLTGNDAVVQVYIRDTGHGIPAEDISHLFQKFYRVDNSATRTIGGTGLGLFICRKIVELYKGKIWVESKINEGSTFYINLPRLSTQQAEQIKQQSDKPGATTSVKPVSAAGPTTVKPTEVANTPATGTA